MKLYFATHNDHKLGEAAQIITTLGGSNIELLSLRDLACQQDIEETADTLEGNSLQKAMFVYNNYGVDCFADDTGLEVESLNGAPGVYSARYAGEPANDKANRDKLLNELAKHKNRRARMRTVVTLIIKGEIKQFEGVVNGKITTQERGEQGFGYDAIFLPDGYDQTFAQLPTEIKNKISHRASSLQKMIEYLTK